MFFSRLAPVITLLAGSVPAHGRCLFEPDDNGHVEWPTNKRTVPTNAFRDCAELISINLNLGVKRINKNAFRGCEELKKIKFPIGMRFVDTSAFFATNIDLLEVAAPERRRVEVLVKKKRN